MRLIDGDALKRKIQKVATEAWKMKLTAPIETTFNQCMDYIDNAPTIKQKQGKWILSSDEQYEYCTCSECGYENGENWMIGSDIPYCQNCGAKMKESRQ